MTRQLRANQRIDPFVFSRRPEVSTLTTAGVKYSSPWPSVKRVLSLAAVCLAKRDEQGGEGGEGGCENSRWKTSRPFLRLGAVVAGGPAAGGLASSWLCGLQHTDFWLTLPSFTASLLFKLLFNVCFFSPLFVLLQLPLNDFCYLYGCCHKAGLVFFWEGISICTLNRRIKQA